MAVKTKKKSMQYGDAKKAAETAGGFVSTSIKVPDGMSFFPKITPKLYRFVFAPYLVGKGNPAASEGSLFYYRMYYTHGRIGADENTYVCARRTFGKRCAVCDQVTKLRSVPTTPEKVLKDLEPKVRQLFIVRDQDDKDKGWRILDISWHLLGKQLGDKLKMLGSKEDEDEVAGKQYDYGNFFHLEGGGIVKILMEEENGGGYTFCKAKSIDIVARKEDLPDDLPGELPCLDDILIETPYKTLERILMQGDAEGDEDDDGEVEIGDEDVVPKKKAKKAPVEEEEEEDDVEVDDEDEPAPKKKAKAPVEGDEDDDLELEDEDEDDEVEETLKFDVGDTVKFDYRGKTFKGVIQKINVEAETVSVQTEGREKPNVVDFDDIELVKKGKAAPKPGSPAAKAAAKKGKPKPADDDEDDDLELEDEDDNDSLDDEEEEEAPKKPAKASKSKAFTEEVEDDDDFDIDMEDEEEEEEEDEEEEEPAPKKKAKGKK